MQSDPDLTQVHCWGKPPPTACIAVHYYYYYGYIITVDVLHMCIRLLWSRLRAARLPCVTGSGTLFAIHCLELLSKVPFGLISFA